MPKILIIVNHRAFRDVLCFALPREGYAVIDAENGTRGLSLVVAERPDLIILDLEMPELDGIEVCRRLRLSGDRTPILFLSSRDDGADGNLGLELGGDDYIGKPFSLRELVWRAQSVLQRHANATV